MLATRLDDTMLLMRADWAIVVVSDDEAWTERTEAVLRQYGVCPIHPDGLASRLERGRVALLLDERLGPHGGAELGAEIEHVLGDACPPLMLATAGSPSLTDEQRAALRVVSYGADSERLATGVLRALA